MPSGEANASFLKVSASSSFAVGAYIENKLGSNSGQVALQRLRSAPEHALGCPEFQPASANQSLGRLWPHRAWF